MATAVVAAAPTTPRRGPLGRVAASFATAVGSHLLLGLFAPLLAALVAMLVVRGLVAPERREGRALPASLGLLAILLLAPALFGALLVPLKAAIQGVLSLFGGVEAVASPFWRHVLVTPWVDAVLGGCALVAAVIGLLRLGTTWRKLATARNLPTSRARSAATGLVELQGTARPAAWRPHPAVKITGPAVDWEAIVPPDAFIHRESRPILEGGSTRATYELARPFVLEDPTGQILIDPRGGKFGDFTTLYVFGEPAARLALSSSSLRDGDPVYVLGEVETRADAPAAATDSERLVVRATRGWRASTLTPRSPLALLAGALGRRQIFLLSDCPEIAVRRGLEKSILDSFLYALLLLIAGLWMVLSHAPGLVR